MLELARRYLLDAWARKPVRPAALAGTASHLLLTRETALASAVAAAERALLVLPAP